MDTVAADLNATRPSRVIGGIALAHSFLVARVMTARRRADNVAGRYHFAAQFVVGELEGAPSPNGLQQS